MKELSRIASAVQASATMAMDSLSKQMKADGYDILSFAAGEPDFNTPDHIKEAAVQAIHENDTRYTPASGTMALKKAICERMKADCAVEYEPSQVVVASGAKHVIYLTLQTLVNPGDEVILPTPGWVSYFEMIRMAGGTPVTVYAGEEERFKLTPEKLEAAITPQTKAIIFNNPSNPSGMIYDREELQALADICVKHDLYIISDEIYYSLTYDGATFVSMAALGEAVKKHTILINGVSKSYAMTGWRIGYALAEPEIAQIMSRYTSNSTGSPCTISQRAALAGLIAPQDEVEVMRQAFQTRRDYIVDRVNSIQGIHCLRPEGAFYILINVKDVLGRTIGGVPIGSAQEFATELLKQGLVATVPGEGFGAPGFIRWSYAASMENIRKGMDRLEEFLMKK